MKNNNKNFLDYIPQKNSSITWETDNNGNVTLKIENNGLFNKIAQRFFKKPKTSFIHLDEIGSFVWPRIDGNSSIFIIGKNLREHFGENAEPIYERLSKYFKILESYGFIKFM